MNYKYKAAILICTYNPKWEELKKTVESSLEQRQDGFLLQIVVADDGSKEDHFDKLREYFAQVGFEDYCLAKLPENQGTVCNLKNGCNYVDAEYIKDISPGDYFSRPQFLSEWIDALEKSGKVWSFTDAYYYHMDGENRVITNEYAHPQAVKPYLNKNDALCRWNYVVYSDVILGATLLAKAGYYKEYIDRICGKVKYAEDHMLILMSFDGLVGFYYEKPSIYYEYGVGISSNGSDKWTKLLAKDYGELEKIMFADVEKLDSFQKLIYKAYQLKGAGNKLIKLIKAPHRLWLLQYNISKDYFTRKTPNENSTH